MSKIEVLESDIIEAEIVTDEAAAEAEYSEPPETEPADLWHRAGWDSRVARRLALGLSPLSSAFYNWQMRRGGVQAQRQKVQLAKYPAAAAPLKAVFLTDLHYGPTTGTVAPAQAWKLARAAQPDLLLLGGDFLYADSRGLPALLRELLVWKKNPPPAGIFACLGNHDYLQGVETLTTCLEACGVRVLVNEAAPLPAPWAGIYIAGSDDELMGQPDATATLAEVPRDACTVLLAHEPDVCRTNLPTQVSLTLCGHTHGGQICLPSGQPLRLPSKWDQEYLAGLYRHAGRWLYVSRGVGVTSLPIRMWSPPDVSILELSGQARRSNVKLVSKP